MAKSKNTYSLMHKDRKYNAELLLAMLTPAIMAWYYFGFKAILLVLSGMVSAFIIEYIGTKIFQTEDDVKDLSALATGAAISLMLPVDAPVWLAVAGSAFAILVAKIPFGGDNNTPFVPAAAGYAFITVCRPDLVFSNTSSPAAMLKLGNGIKINSINMINVFTGNNIQGAIGTTCVVVILGAFLFFVVRRWKTMLPSIGFLLTCAIMAMLFPRVETGILSSVVTELCAGSLIFVAVFILSDVTILPQNLLKRFFYGVFAGVIAMCLRYFGAFEDSACFAVLLVNATLPIFISLKKWRVKHEK